MNKINFYSTIGEIYYQAIDLTTELVKNHLKKSKNKKKSKYDIPTELKTRWKARMDCLFRSSEGSWSKFHEYVNKRSEHQEDGKKKPFVPHGGTQIIHFPLVYKMSWDVLWKICNKNKKIPRFKSWIWNYLVVPHLLVPPVPVPQGGTKMGMGTRTYTVSRYICVQQAIGLIYKKAICFEKIRKEFKSKNQLKCKRNLFTRYGLIVNKNFHRNKSFKSVIVCKAKKFIRTNCSPFNIKWGTGNKDIVTYNSGDLVKSEYDQETESQISKERKKNAFSDFIISTIDKIYRKNNKWRVILRDGIMHFEGKDLSFNSCRCELSW